MPHARLTHPTRPTLEFRQGQTDEESIEAVADITAEIGVNRPPLVHIETRERTRRITGRVTAPRRAQNDGTTSDWEQALANYVDLLEAHCDEFQGFPPSSGYTFVDDIRSESLNAVLHGVEWTLMPGSPYEIEFSADVTIGRGTFDDRAIQTRDPSVDTAMSVPAKAGGNDLPGLREMVVRREFGIDPRPVYDVSSAENNDIVASDGVRQMVTYRGTHTGTDATRAAADAALAGLQGSQVTFETRFPGYDLDGFVLDYSSNLEARLGAGMHQYSLVFIEGDRA